MITVSAAAAPPASSGTPAGVASGHAVGVVDDEHLPRRHRRAAARPCARARGPPRCGSAACLWDFLGRRGHDHVQVGMLRRRADAAPARAAAALGAEQRGGEGERGRLRPDARGPDEGVGVGDAAGRERALRAAPPRAADPRRAPERAVAGAPRRRERASTPPRPRGRGDGRRSRRTRLGIGALDLQVALAHARGGTRAPRARSDRAAGRRCGASPSAGSRSNSSVRSGRTPPVASSVELADGLRDRAAAVALVGDRGVGVAVAEHDTARGEPGPDHLGHVLVTGGEEEEHLGEGGPRPRARRARARRRRARCRRARAVTLDLDARGFEPAPEARASGWSYPTPRRPRT